MVILVEKTNLERTMCLSCPMPLIKTNILLVNVDILIQEHEEPACDD
jgi:hypothetical protein